MRSLHARNGWAVDVEGRTLGTTTETGKVPSAGGGANEALATRPYRESGMGKKRRRQASCPRERRLPWGDAAAFGKGASRRKTVSGTIWPRMRARYSLSAKERGRGVPDSLHRPAS